MTWRADVLEEIPEPRIKIEGWTFPSAREIIEIAAYNRRIRTEDFVGRAALAFAVYDSDGEISWKQATRLEPLMGDLRRHGMPKKRKFGRDFGDWEIESMK